MANSNGGLVSNEGQNLIESPMLRSNEDEEEDESEEEPS